MPWNPEKEHPRAKVGESEFIALFEEHGPTITAEKIGMTLRRCLARRAAIELKIGRSINAPDGKRPKKEPYPATEIPGRISLKIHDGVVLVGSDAHYWPGEASTAHRAFVKFCKRLKPKIVVMNGDVLVTAALTTAASM